MTDQSTPRTDKFQHEQVEDWNSRDLEGEDAATDLALEQCHAAIEYASTLECELAQEKQRSLAFERSLDLQNDLLAQARAEVEETTADFQRAAIRRDELRAENESLRARIAAFTALSERLMAEHDGECYMGFPEDHAGNIAGYLEHYADVADNHRAEADGLRAQLEAAERERDKMQSRFDYIAANLPEGWGHCTTEKELCVQIKFTEQRAERAEQDAERLIEQCVEACAIVRRDAHAAMMDHNPGSILAKKFANVEDGAEHCIAAIRALAKLQAIKKEGVK